MSDTIIVPRPDELVGRIQKCRAELAALKKLLRLARAAEAARKANERREDPLRLNSELTDCR